MKFLPYFNFGRTIASFYDSRKMPAWNELSSKLEKKSALTNVLLDWIQLPSNRIDHVGSCFCSCHWKFQIFHLHLPFGKYGESVYKVSFVLFKVSLIRSNFVMTKSLKSLASSLSLLPCGSSSGLIFFPMSLITWDCSFFGFCHNKHVLRHDISVVSCLAASYLFRLSSVLIAKYFFLPYVKTFLKCVSLRCTISCSRRVIQKLLWSSEQFCWRSFQFPFYTVRRSN